MVQLKIVVSITKKTTKAMNLSLFKLCANANYIPNCNSYNFRCIKRSLHIARTHLHLKYFFVDSCLCVCVCWTNSSNIFFFVAMEHGICISNIHRERVVEEREREIEEERGWVRNLIEWMSIVKRISKAPLNESLLIWL